MSTRISPKTPYEIRLELLQLAQTILLEKHSAEFYKNNPTADRKAISTYATTEDIITEAEKMNGFVSKANPTH